MSGFAALLGVFASLREVPLCPLRLCGKFFLFLGSSFNLQLFNFQPSSGSGELWNFHFSVKLPG